MGPRDLFAQAPGFSEAAQSWGVTASDQQFSDCLRTPHPARMYLDPTELLFTWVIATYIYHIRNEN